MNDLISRQAAIEVVKRYLVDCHVEDADWHGYGIECELENLPPTQQWIPVSERLPEADGRYLVTCSEWGVWTVDWNIWHNVPKPSWLWEQGVTAWMHLPEPYKEEDNERV